MYLCTAPLPRRMRLCLPHSPRHLTAAAAFVLPLAGRVCNCGTGDSVGGSDSPILNHCFNQSKADRCRTVCSHLPLLLVCVAAAQLTIPILDAKHNVIRSMFPHSLQR